MNEPKRHHSVPEMLQRRFADSRGMLWYFDKERPDQGVKDTHANNLFVRNRQYTLKRRDGTRDWSLETHYSNLESYMKLLIDKIVPSILSGIYPSVTPNERALLDIYVYEQWRRVPELYDGLISDDDFSVMLHDSIAQYENKYRPLTPDERERLTTPEYLKAEKQRARVLALRRQGTAREYLSKRGLFFARTARNRSFVLSSAPVIKMHPVGHPHLNDPRVEIWLPIDPNVAIVLAGDGSVNRIISVGPQIVRNYNREVAKRGTAFAGRDKALVVSIARQFMKPLALTPQ